MQCLLFANEALRNALIHAKYMEKQYTHANCYVLVILRQSNSVEDESGVKCLSEKCSTFDI